MSDTHYKEGVAIWIIDKHEIITSTILRVSEGDVFYEHNGLSYLAEKRNVFFGERFALIELRRKIKSFLTHIDTRIHHAMKKGGG